MKSLQNNKGVIAAIIIFIFVMFIYNLLFKSDEVLVVNDGQGAAIGSDLVEIYNNLGKVTLDTALFSMPVYKKLTDFSIEVPLQPVGRSNPFDIIGR